MGPRGSSGFPSSSFYWLDPVPAPVPVGARGLGMIHAPNIRIGDAMQHIVVGPNRGRMPGFTVVNSRPVKGLPEAFGLPPTPGEGMAVRLRYSAGGATADEDVFGFLGSGNRVPYTGPQGTWYESHRPLVLAHAVGATGGKLEGMYPLLGFIATSMKVDPAWEAHRQRVLQYLSAEFNRYIAQGYAQIQAAAQLSRTISANNDAMLASMQAQRQAQAQRDAARRAAAASASTRSPNDEFSLYIRGTERMKDPYWGESEQSYHQRYDARYRYIRNDTPERPFLQPNEYKQRQYPVWNLLKELDAAGKLTPVQAALCAPTMPEEELYDLETDPHEIHNLAKSSRHQRVLKRLRGALEKWIEDSNDQGREREPVELPPAKA